jgi:hypothetical protein
LNCFHHHQPAPDHRVVVVGAWSCACGSQVRILGGFG